MKILKTLMTLGLIICTTEIFSQDLPDSFQSMLNENVTYFKTITGSNSISKGSTSLSVINDNKIALKLKQKGEVKNLTFVTTTDEENNSVWIAANPLTIDMVNKYSDDLEKTLETMTKLAEKKSKE